MPTEPTSQQKQRLAFNYLRARACRSHLEGDGLRVNSLCAVALSQAEDLANGNKLQVTLADLRWCYILPLYWLIDDYMPYKIDSGLSALVKVGKAENWLHDLLREYYFLISQPLAPPPSAEKLTGAPISNLGDANQCEDLVLLTHIIELFWFRTTGDGIWETLLDQWIKICPGWAQKPLIDLKARLAFQSRLTVPTHRYPPIVRENVKKLPDEFRLAELWVELLCSDGKTIDQAIEKLNAITEPDSHIARLLFDAHHFNRLLGRFGDSQTVGLARRRLLVSSSPLLTFNEFREAKLSEQFGELVRRSEVGAASQRFRLFTLAMLCEISALRLWDFCAWCEAVKAQAEAYLEVSKWDAPPELAAFGIRLAIQSLSYKSQKKDALLRNAISRLEFATPEALLELGQWLPMPYSRQKPYAYAALEDLCDLIPSGCWEQLAEWTIGYLEECRQGKHFGGSLIPLEAWTIILQFVENSSKIWNLFQPEIINLARNQLVWRSNEDILSIWLAKAPILLAQQVGTEMLSIRNVDNEARERRAKILFDAEKHRQELAGRFSPDLIKLTSEPIEQLSLGVVDNPDLRAAAKEKYRGELEKYVTAAVPSPDIRTFNFGFISNGPIMLLEWNSEDINLVEKIIATIDNPSTLTNSLFSLLMCLETLIRHGPKEFADVTFQKFCKWLENPPIGRDPMSSMQGPFSVMQFRSLESEIEVGLGWLAFQMKFKLGSKVDPIVVKWLQKSLLAPEPRAIPIMLYATLPAVSSLNETGQADLLTSCQTLLLHIWSRIQSGERIGINLSKALDYIGDLLQREDHPLGQWNTDGGKRAIELFISKFSSIIVAFSYSTDPDVRKSAAGLIRKFKKWKRLPAELEQALERLSKDNRARVRYEAMLER